MASRPPTAAADARERDRRFEVARAAMRRHGLDALVVADFAESPQPSYARYLSGFHFSPAIGPINHVVVLPLEGDATLIVPPGQKRSFAHIAAGRSWIENIVTTYRDDPEWERKTRWGHLVTDLGGPVADALETAGLSRARVGVAGSWAGFETTQQRLSDATFVPTVTAGEDGTHEDILVDLIWTTSAWEAERLKLAQRAGDAATRAYIGAARAGAGTREAWVDAVEAARRGGVDDVTLYGSAGVAPWAFWDLAHPASPTFASDRVYFIEVAFAGWSGFGVQSGRSFVLDEPTERQQLLIDTSQRALAALQAAVRPGVTGGDLWDVGIAVAEEAGLDSWAQFGHHKGLLPAAAARRIAFMPGNPHPLERGQTVVLHPGLFDRATNEAAFIGDTVLVEEDGYRLFTDEPLPYGLRDI
jgi:Xaa-Pro aminopeptidase